MMTRSILSVYGILMINNQFPPSYGGVTNIDPEFKKKIDSAPTGSTWTVIIIFKKDQQIFDSIYKYVENLNVPPGESYMKSYEAMIRLEKYSEETQGKVIQAITNFQKTYPKVRQSTFWISNDRGVWKAPKDLLYLLGDVEKPEFENITKIVESKGIPMEKPDPNQRRSSRPPGGRGGTGVAKGEYDPTPECYGLRRINAPAWWQKNYNGSGVIIGHIDTGVDSRHPSLKWNWLGKGEGWLDPQSADNTFPFEDNKEVSHGTHTIGVIIGRGENKTELIEGQKVTEDDVEYFGVGVAPGARWISCLGCRDGICYPDDMHECGKFIHCPNPKNKCRYTPDVVSLSNGYAQSNTSEAIDKDFPYQRMIALFKSAGIIPVFSAGNRGLKGCQTINEPDNEDIISVGNTAQDDVLFEESSMGPPLWRYNESYIKANKIFKPDIVAPGTAIFSTEYTGQGGEFVLDWQTGTSQAAPHVAGAIALLLSRTKGLSFNQIREILFNYTVPNSNLSSSTPFMKCGNYSDTDQPNHKFGWGRLRLPDPDELDKLNFTEQRPTRKMPPPPDYSTLDDNSRPPSVRPGMVGVVVMMAAIAFLMMNAARMEI